VSTTSLIYIFNNCPKRLTKLKLSNAPKPTYIFSVLFHIYMVQMK